MDMPVFRPDDPRVPPDMPILRAGSHRTCPFHAAATGHSAYMSTPLAQGWTCPFFGPMTPGSHRTCPSFGPGPTGHAHSTPQPLDIVRICPLLSPRDGHV